MKNLNSHPTEIVDLKFAKSNFGSKKEVVKFLQGLKPSLIEDMQAIENAYHHQEWELMRSKAHRLKGPCSMAGAFKVKLAARQLDEHIRKNQFLLEDELYKKLKDEIIELLAYIESVKC